MEPLPAFSFLSPSDNGFVPEKINFSKHAKTNATTRHCYRNTI